MPVVSLTASERSCRKVFADDVAMFTVALILLRSVEFKARVTTVIKLLVVGIPPSRAMKAEVFSALSRILKPLKLKELATGSSNVIINWPVSRSKSKLLSVGDIVSPSKSKAWIA